MRRIFDFLFGAFGYRREHEYEKVREMLYEGALFAIRNKGGIVINLPSGVGIEIKYRP